MAAENRLRLIDVICESDGSCACVTDCGGWGAAGAEGGEGAQGATRSD